MGGMTLNRGKFYKDGVQVPLEFGNKEQIRLLQKGEEFKKGFWVPLGTFNCLCGYQISLTDFRNGKTVCYKCYNIYLMQEDEEDGSLIIKLK